MSSFKKRVEARMAETGENWQQATLYVRSLAPREEPVTTLPLAILDTNVFLDIHSCHDVKNAIDGLHGRLGDAAIDEPAVTYRLARARESVLLAMYFHSVGATTFNLHNEAVDLLLKRSPPAAGGTTMESDFTTVFLHFVKDYVLPDWQPTMPHGTWDGGEERGGSCARRGAFLRRFKARAPDFLADRRRRFGERDQMHKVLTWIFGYYLLILRGEVEGRSAPVRVRVEPAA